VLILTVAFLIVHDQQKPTHTFRGHRFILCLVVAGACRYGSPVQFR
jgi:hypothetical protein